MITAKDVAGAMKRRTAGMRDCDNPHFQLGWLEGDLARVLTILQAIAQPGTPAREARRLAAEAVEGVLR